MHRPKFEATDEELQRLDAGARDAGMSRNEFLRKLVSPVTQQRASPVWVQARIWVLEFQIDEKQRHMRALARERARIAANLAALPRRTSATIRGVFTDTLNAIDAEAEAEKAALAQLTQEVDSIRNMHQQPDTAPVRTTAATPAILAIALPASLSNPTTILLALLAIAAAAVVIMRSRYGVVIAGAFAGLKKQHDEGGVITHGIDAGAPKPPTGATPPRGDNEQELLARFLHDPRHLEDRIQDFLDQADGEERLRQLCEDATFTTKAPPARDAKEPTVTKVHLLVVSEAQLQSGIIEPGVLQSLRSRRGRPDFPGAPSFDLPPPPPTAPIHAAAGSPYAELNSGPRKARGGRPRKDEQRLDEIPTEPAPNGNGKKFGGGDL